MTWWAVFIYHETYKCDNDSSTIHVPWVAEQYVTASFVISVHQCTAGLVTFLGAHGQVNAETLAYIALSKCTWFVRDGKTFSGLAQTQFEKDVFSVYPSG